MLDPKTAGSYLAGRHMGKVAGRIEAENASKETIDVQGMAIDKLRERVEAERARTVSMAGVAGYYLAVLTGAKAVLGTIQKESIRAAEHMAKFGSMTDAEMQDISPLTVERRNTDATKRPLSRRISKEAALAFAASEVGQKEIFGGLEFSAAERVRILERVRAEIEKQM